MNLTDAAEKANEDSMLAWVARGRVGGHGVDMDDAFEALLRLSARGLVHWQNGKGWLPGRAVDTYLADGSGRGIDL